MHRRGSVSTLRSWENNYSLSPNTFPIGQKSFPLYPRRTCLKHCTRPLRDALL